MDTRLLLELLNANSCRYVVIGALAFPHYGYGRATLDVDIFIAPTAENARNVRKALAEFGFDVADVTVYDLLQYKLFIRDYSLQVDIHPFVSGVEFESVWENAQDTVISGIPTRVPSLKDLIRMKRAAGRPKDLEDLKFLNELASAGRKREA